MKKDISNWVKCCDQCQKGKVIRHNKSPLSQFTIPPGRFENLRVDIVRPIPSCNGYKYILTIMDRFSPWFTATAMRDIIAESTVDAFMNGWIQHFGCPKSVVTYQGGQFTSHLWSSYMNILGIKLVTTTSYHPQSNGLVENLHRHLKDALRMQKYPNQWYYSLPIVTMVLRTTQKEDLHHSPAELVYGQDLHLPGEFKTKLKHDFFQRDTLAHSLKEFVKELHPVSTRVHAEKKVF